MAESQSTDAGKPGKIAATFITNGAVQAAEVTVAREGDPGGARHHGHRRRRDG
jgi:hypothetical protein